MSKRSRWRYVNAIIIAVSAALGASAPPIHAYESPLHVFSIDDVQGGFDGSTFGTEVVEDDATSIICGVEGGTLCPEDNQPFLDKSGVMLYPVDSEFGFYIVDFLGAQGKIRDGDYLEGFVGNIWDGDTVIGIQVSNAATEKYKVKPPLGTWCQGLGGTSVKCETEHYTVMEHVLSCYETVPYFFVENPLAEPLPLPPPTATQAILSTPDGSLTFDCANAPLDDNTLILAAGVPTNRLVDATPCESGTPGEDEIPDGCQMFPNDKTDMQNNIALSSDYSVQLKDDGKPLYGWGGLHKRPNDIRMYARLALPEEWKELNEETGELNDFPVTKAELVVNHWITNNPNDQLRPEDLENEAATGRKPSYRIDTDGRWRSTVPCYEGDGDLIDTEEGGIDSTFIGIGTILKNTPYELDPTAEPGDLPADPPYAFSSDLQGGFTNAFYTTINRDPFEWSYVNETAFSNGVFDFIGSEFPLTEAEIAAGGLVLVSGPRWRLKPNKFGQDLPGLEIPSEECSPPPFQSDNIKYVVGTPVTTVINLLDWDESEGPSPLATSKGWVDVTANEFVTVVDDPDSPVPYTTNGLPMTNDFDLAVYVKGDRKSTAVYNARLIIEYVGEVPQPPTDFDLALSELNVPDRVLLGALNISATVVVKNFSPANVSGAVVTLTGVTNRGDTILVTPASETLDLLISGEPATVTFEWTAPDGKPSTITWTAVVTADGDTNPANDTATAQTKVRRN